MLLYSFFDLRFSLLITSAFPYPNLRWILRRPVARFLRRSPPNRVHEHGAKRGIFPRLTIVPVLEIHERALLRRTRPCSQLRANLRVTPAARVAVGKRRIH